MLKRLSVKLRKKFVKIAKKKLKLNAHDKHKTVDLKIGQQRTVQGPISKKDKLSITP